jgi:hypothetical protein
VRSFAELSGFCGEVIAIYKRKLSRQILAFASVTFRWPILLVLSLCRFFKFNCIFTVYPGSQRDVDGYFPNGLKWLLKPIASGKPFVAGVITTGNGLGRGLVLAVPNSIDQIRSDRQLVGKIMKRLNLTRQLTGAKTIAIAGQGPRYFKSHYPYQKPFVYGLRGRVFSVVESVERIMEKHHLERDKTTVAILGVGEIGEAIIENMKEKGVKAVGIDIQVKEGRVELCSEEREKLKNADLVVVQTPRGDDVVPYYPELKKTAILVDDSHPRITSKPSEVHFYKVAIGRPGVEFRPPLPGYEHYWIPGCVQESMVVAETGNHDLSQEDFNRRAKDLGFYAHLIDDRESQEKGVKATVNDS